jgi:subtilase family serine protease
VLFSRLSAVFMLFRIGLSRLALLLYLVTSPLPRILGQISVESQRTVGSVRLSGSISPRARREDDRGPVDSARKLSHMTLVFRRTPEQRAALDRWLEELQNPSSPDYHKWLTPEEFGERFGASTDNLNRAADWLRSEGFTVEATAHGRSWIDFSGTVATVQNTFHTEIHNYQTGTKTHFAPTDTPAIPPEFETLVGGIRGLDDFYFEPSRRLEPMFTASDGTHALAPGDLARIYNFTHGPTGAGLTIAIAGESALNLADIRQFRSTFQLPPNDPQTLLAGDDPGIDARALLEADADIEWAGAVAHDAKIVYAYATDAMVASQTVIDQNLAPILVFSFGNCESHISQSDASSIRELAQQANAQGITWIASSGDAGAAACDQGSYPATQGLSVSFPASLPEVTAVGGTEFNEQNSGWCGQNPSDLSSVCDYLPEIAWNDTSPASGLRASGGGASALYPKPSWQTGLGVPNDGARDVPDLAFTASPAHDPYIVISGGKIYGIGGTSLSAPVFAGAMALAEQGQSDNSGGSSGFGNINPSLYALANQPFPDLVFHDITTGNNLVPCAVGTKDCANGSLGYSAGPGYDLVTGLGSLNIYYFSGVPLATTTILSVSDTEIPEGTPLTLTAMVRTYGPTVPKGSVEFFGVKFATVSGGSGNLDASGTTSVTGLLAHGTYTIAAKFFPFGRFVASTSASVTVVVVPVPPQAPTLVSPSDNVPDVSVSVPLVWSKVPFANSYDVYFGTTPSPPFWGRRGNAIFAGRPGSEHQILLEGGREERVWLDGLRSLIVHDNRIDLHYLHHRRLERRRIFTGRCSSRERPPFRPQRCGIGSQWQPVCGGSRQRPDSQD